MKIPLIDIGAFSESEEGSVRVAREMGRACEELGFAIVQNHGVDRDIIERCWNASRDFFDLPLSERMYAFPEKEGYAYGYTRMGSEALARTENVVTPPDLKEAFAIGPLEVPEELVDCESANEFGYAPNIWPRRPNGFRDALEAYYGAMNDLGRRIMEIFATSLRLDRDWFKPFTTHPVSALRILNYPKRKSKSLPGQYRAGPHTDYGCLTMLLQEEGRGGLQVISGGEWQDVPTIPDAFVINLGDMMARWTNDRWVSTMHRVVDPPECDETVPRRQSVAFFYQPNWDAEVKCIPSCLGSGDKPKYPTVLAGEHIAHKFRKSRK